MQAFPKRPQENTYQRADGPPRRRRAPRQRQRHRRAKRRFRAVGPEELIRHILKIEAEGSSLRWKPIYTNRPDLFHAAKRHYGTWGKALKAAGIDRESVSNRRDWTVSRVVRTIHDLDRQGVALNHASAARADPGLVRGAKNLLGTWDNALQTAGYDSGAVRLHRPRWTRKQIVALLQRRAHEGLPVAAQDIVPRTAVSAAQKLFGSWAAAREVAGLAGPPARRPHWSRVTIVEAILLRRQADKPLDYTTAVREFSGLHDAARRYFGSWREALRAAGIDPRGVHRRVASNRR